MDGVTLSVTEFVQLLNQTLEFAYPLVTIEGEVSEFRVSKNRWVYFKLQDDESSVQFFGSVYQLQVPVEDGMLVVVSGQPKLHNRYGFSVNVRTITPSGEGNIKRAFELLKAKLNKEGLFDADRKRPIPRFPNRIGLITSGQAAAYADFLKILNARWGGVAVLHADVHVQGEHAPGEIVNAIKHFNEMANPVDVLVLTRGGGSAEDLQAFSTEPVARAVAGSRTPIVVGVGHETDVSLADLAADVRAATPSNAAQIVVEDRQEISGLLNGAIQTMHYELSHHLVDIKHRLLSRVTVLQEAMLRPLQVLQEYDQQLLHSMEKNISKTAQSIGRFEQTIAVLDPKRLLKRGYSLVRTKDGTVITRAKDTKRGDQLMIELSEGSLNTEVIDG